jgi:hypothetical protein
MPLAWITSPCPSLRLLRRTGGRLDRAATPTGSRASRPSCATHKGGATRLRSVPKTLVVHLDQSVCDRDRPGLEHPPHRFLGLGDWSAAREPGGCGLRSVDEHVSEGVLFEVKAGVRHVTTEYAVLGGEAVKRRMSQPSAPLRSHLLRVYGSRTPPDLCCAERQLSGSDRGSVLDFAHLLYIVKYPNPGA